MTFRVCLIEDNPKVCETLKDHFARDFESSTTVFDNCSDAINWLDQNYAEIIIVRSVLTSEERAAQKIFSYLYDKEQTHLPVLSLGEIDFVAKEISCLPSKFRLEELNRQVIKLLRIDKDQIFLLKKPSFIGFPLRDYFLMKTAPCDLYLKIERRDGPQFIKRIHESDEIDREALQRYEGQGTDEIFVKKENWNSLMRSFLTAASTGILKLEKQETYSHLEISDFYGLVKDMVSFNRGHSVTEEFIHLLAKTVQAGDYDFKNFYINVNQVLKSKALFDYKHARLQIHLGLACIDEIDWYANNKDKKTLIDQLIYCCLLKDLYLQEPEEFEIISLDKYNHSQEKLTPEARERVENHAYKAAALAQSLSHLPNGVDIIVKQHHGSDNGVGLMLYHNIGISPMAMFLIVLDDLSLEILKKSGDGLSKANLEVILSRVFDHFSSATYLKVIQAIQRALT